VLKQRLEGNEKGLCNTLTSVQKDNLVMEKGDYVARCYGEFIEKKGYIPEKFVAYNRTEVGDIAPTLTGQCCSPSGSSAVLMMEKDVEPTVAVKVATKQGYEEASKGDYVNITYPGSKTKRGRVGKGMAHTITCGDGNAVITENVRIRKLTPRECLRLMGWKDEQIDKIQSAKVSGTQQYRQAGNGIVVQVLEAIFNALFFA
jgi:DNA (cytosine-5)-methyltransferase 1